MGDIKKGTVTLMTANMERSIHFYTDVLGFTLKKRFENEWAEIDAPSLSIGLHPLKGNKGQGSVSLGFQVKNIHTLVSHLEQKGISVTLQDEGYLLLAQFKDPDGTPLYFAEMKK